jgi:chromosome segregation ATPase
MLPARPADATQGAGIDRWEEGFDSWTPRRGGDTPDDTGVDLDREALLRLARELAEKRHSEQQHAGAELERLKQSLRERAEAIAARERELADLQVRLGEGKPRKQNKQKPPDTASTDALVARERAALDRAQTLEARERELQARAAELEGQAAQIEQRELELATELALAQSQVNESLSERELASAERAKLEERAEEARRVEKELAARRIELEQERGRLETRAREVEARTRALEEIPAERAEQPADPVEQRESELRRLETTLEARERELALVRQSLDAERNALLERERGLRRREVAEVRQSFDAPLVAPSFSEGLAAFVSWRSNK